MEGIIDDGPAVEYVSGNLFWYKEGFLHREDGPAAEYSNGEKYFYLNGQSFFEKDYWAIIKFGAFI